MPNVALQVTHLSSDTLVFIQQQLHTQSSDFLANTDAQMPNSMWMRSCQRMGVEKVRKDDTARTL